MKIKQGSEYAIKPCRLCGFCPYGPLVEDFPFSEEPSDRSCSVFGHDCPVYYVAEGFMDTNDLGPVDRADWELFMSDLMGDLDNKGGD